MKHIVSLEGQIFLDKSGRFELIILKKNKQHLQV